ncbi:hypothetical protein EYC98_21190 [Halieaceae bacterium IMCC14734]|uniref:Bacterial repeat domain-containing protein n=2 Tax=Candidatus Litorirhabdus singularis TaxID=2518993 RepID=A0ABT3TM23_9GAMM|nr:hypothetical protein [Candidatus Litorirhabdus singularis]
MNGFITKPLIIISLAAAMTGCKLSVLVSSGGAVQSGSGSMNCSGPDYCEFEITDPNFSEVFTAVARPGYEFEKWQRGSGFYCGDSTDPVCSINIDGGSLGDAIVAGFGNGHIMPVFKNVGIDTDADGVRNELDDDDDNDGTLDGDDRCPLDAEDQCANGTPSMPFVLSLGTPNPLLREKIYNYYSYGAKENEKLIIHAELDEPMNDTEKARCGASPGSGTTASTYDTQIHVYDDALSRIGGICGENLVFSFSEAGDYIIQFDYPTNAPGNAYVASILGSSAISDPTGEIGTPSVPANLEPGVEHPISANTFYNYFQYQAGTNERIILQAILDTPLSGQQKARCSANPGYDTQIRVYDANMDLVGLVCGETLDFTFPETGTYIFQFSYAAQSAGYFVAAIVD